jgi:cytochrome c oxidase subunit I
MSGRQYPERAGKLHFWGTFISPNLTFFPIHMLGAAGMARRYIDDPEPFSGWNMLISCGAYFGAALFLVGLGLFSYTLLADRRSPRLTIGAQAQPHLSERCRRHLRITRLRLCR